ncbi:thioredoxin-related transmembrane protein 1 [Cylas formicarius]|uniref:thioredoxin-related transmembrane protein 1 n=1 Tax=Cylas formicarius TaxID=197179 RepID=UPI00295877DE|nr:thioredoxin-related transmembrane protein 1 [Cylas formicarius]
MSREKSIRVAFLLLTCVLSTTAAQKVAELDENNWTQILEGEWMVEFYAPWCPACKALEQRWEEFSKSGPALGIKVGAVDVTTSPGLSGRFMVTALPTIFHVYNGQFRQYKGSRDKDSFSLFVEERKWESVEPVPSWKSPNSLQMSVVSSFFKLSQSLRQLHGTLTNEYGLPTIASYLIFAVATIILGACLGLLLVCAIDLVCPPKQAATKKSRVKDKDSDDELNDDDIKDDLLDNETEDKAKDGPGGDSALRKRETKN